MKKLLVLLFMALFLIGCSAEEVQKEAMEPSSAEPVVEEPVEINPGEVVVDEEVIIPAHEPEPVVEEPEPEPQGDIITEHKDSKHFLHGRPDIGDVLSEAPRKVNLVFSYPILEGTEIEVWDEIRETRYHEGDDTVVANGDSLVAIAYLDDMGPGTYKVEYTVKFATDKEGTDVGYYYFRIE